MDGGQFCGIARQQNFIVLVFIILGLMQRLLPAIPVYIVVYQPAFPATVVALLNLNIPVQDHLLPATTMLIKAPVADCGIQDT
jgi:hypothetical protein